VQITKLEAARRQLVTAIRLFFEDADSVSVYALAHASWEVLDSLCKHEGKIRFRELAADANGLPEDDIKRVASYGKNFFKHADRKPEDVLEDFSDELIDHVLIAATMDFSSLGTAKPMEIQIYPIWYFATYPEKVALPDLKPLQDAADDMFPRLATHDRKHQKAAGLNALLQVRRDRDLMSNPATDSSPMRAIAKTSAY